MSMGFIPGVAEVAILLIALLSGGVGVPVSLPPGEPDPLLDKLAPESCLYFTCWSGAVAPNAGSGNHTEQLFADPEIQQFLKQAERDFRAIVLRTAGNEGQLIGDMAPALARMVLTSPICLYVTDFAPPGPDGPPTINAGLAIKTSGEAKQQLEKLLAMIPAAATVESPVAPGFRQLKLDGPAPPVVFGFKGPYLLAAIGDKEMEAMIGRAGGEAPAWVGQLRARHKIARVSTISYLNLGQLMSKLAPLGGPQVPQLLDQLGLSGLTTFSSVTGLDETGYVNISNLGIEGEPKGILAPLNGQPLTAKDFAAVPLKPYVAIVSRVNAAQVFDNGMGILKSTDPNGAAQMEQQLGALEEAIGFKARDVLGALGDTWSLFMAPEDGGFLSGITLAVDLRDAAKVRQLSEKLQQLAAQEVSDGPSPIAVSQFQQQNIYYANFPDPMPIAPAWAVTDTHLVIGLFPQAIKSFMLRRSDGANLSAAPEVARQLSGEGGPLTLSYVDNKELVELFYPLTHYGLRVLQGQLARQGGQGVTFDISALPTTGAITRYLGAAVSVSRRTADGLELEQRQVLPGGSPAATGPLMAALLLPGIQKVNVSRGRMQSSNNMKQILLAHHNFHDVYKAWPALHGLDKDAKPTLSWRVYILPFIEQDPLFRKFNLDEPWDSPTNKPLIAEMPQIYRSPQSKAAPGLTTYLAVKGDKSVMQPQDPSRAGQKNPSGPAKIRDILDGTSNTVMMVEANDASAVIWTKPDDYEYTAENPAQGLMGVHGGNVLAGFADGSVRLIPATLPKQLWLWLFDRDDGNPVELP